MVISKAIPIKFWTSGDTYNQGIDSIDGMRDAIFNQKWNSTDEIVLQFYDTVAKDYRLQCFDENGVLIDEVTFDRQLFSALYIYSKTFTFVTDFGVSNEIVNLKIIDVYAQITGAIIDTMEVAEGTVLFVSEADLNYITGAATDTMEIASGTLVNAQTALFGFSLPSGVELDSCTLPNTSLYWTSGVAFAQGITLYSDASLSSAFTGKTYISKAGVIHSINTGTGVVGAATGNLC